MELTVDTTNKTNLTNQVTFKATENSTKLFSMLSSYLYSNKELAVLHELSSNAIDAHKTVGKHEIPIEVNLPTNLSPNLRIKDFGPGLSHDNVIRFLTTYGESDKVGDKDLIGGYGIGSKSPTAVTDTWQIISNHNGCGIQYMIAIDSYGIPTLSKLREFVTDETGLEVIIPVHKTQISKWHSAATEAYVHYPVKPVITGSAIALQSTKPMYEVPGAFKIFGSTYGHKKTAVVGSRGYKIDFSKISSNIKLEYYQLFESLDINTTFNLSDLDVDLSRENLRYSTKTLAALTNKFNEIGDIIKFEITKTLSATTTMVDYICAAKMWNDIVGSYLFGFTKTTPYPGLNVNGVYDLNTLKFPIPNNAHYKVGYRDTVSQLTNSFSCGKTYAVGTSYHHAVKTTFITIKVSSFDNVKFVINDDKSTRTRVKQALSVNHNNIYIIVESASDIDSQIPADKIIKGSSLPPRIPVKRAPKTPTIVTNLYVKNGNRFLKIDEARAKGHVSDGNCVLWTYITNGVKDGDINAKELRFINAIKFYPVIIGVKKGTTPPDWCQSVMEFYVDILKKVNDQRQSYVDNVRMIDLKNDIWILNIYRQPIIRELLKDTSLISTASQIIDYTRKDEQISLNQELIKLIDLTNIELSNNILMLSEDLQKQKEKYPLLKYIFAGRYYTLDDDTSNDVVDYVNLIEKEI